MNDLPLDLPAILPDSRAIRQRSWVKRILPTSMFGRSFLLIVMPLIIVQMVSAWAFYARHWETMSRRLSADVAEGIGVTLEGMNFVAGAGLGEFLAAAAGGAP